MSDFLPRAGVAVCALVWCGLVAASPLVGGEPAAPLRVGIARVPAAPLPGAKVRTPVQLEALLIRAGTVALQPQQVSAEQAASRIHQGTLDAWLGAWSPQASLPDGLERVSLDWSASPMAIMRSDTTITQWGELKHRTVCLADDGRYRGELSARYGAVEQVYPSATDALLALRTGRCDATVQDEGFLRELLKFPEWRKFSATLEPYRRQELVRLVRTGLAPVQRVSLSQMTGAATLRAAAKKQARDIAFEVYLDQAVPDCH